jgi:phytanoyl-CoA hydroxylase
MTLSDVQLQEYRQDGHVTCPGIFSTDLMDDMISESAKWTNEFIADLSPEQRGWYVDAEVDGQPLLRKLDDPIHYREELRKLAQDPKLVAAVEQLIGKGVAVPFSQVFFKPPEIGGPKPAHQDNFYFGCNDDDGMVTAWIALDEATVENGCMFFGNGTNNGEIFHHTAPEGEPFNLQISDETLGSLDMTPGPVPKGGVSFHHGNTVHQSSENRSKNWRRAVAIHYVNNKTIFETPALTYDMSKRVQIT